jgi:hypothetical protein
MRRRQFLASLGGLCMSCAAASAQDNPFGAIGGRNPPAPARTPNSRVPTERDGQDVYRGCILTASGQSLFSGGTQLLATSGIPAVDAAFATEINGITIPMFQVSPAVFFFNDAGSPNAFATPERLSGYGNGTVAFGITLMQTILNKFRGSSMISYGDHAMMGVFAHEFGHMAQFAAGLRRVPGKPLELHADYMSGWYNGTRALQLGGRVMVNFDEIARQMFDIGDYEFTSPDHHGTPQERVTAFTRGVQHAITSQGRATVTTALRSGAQLVGL